MKVQLAIMLTVDVSRENVDTGESVDVKREQAAKFAKKWAKDWLTDERLNECGAEGVSCRGSAVRIVCES